MLWRVSSRLHSRHKVMTPPFQHSAAWFNPQYRPILIIPPLHRTLAYCNIDHIVVWCRCRVLLFLMLLLYCHVFYHQKNRCDIVGSLHWALLPTVPKQGTVVLEEVMRYVHHYTPSKFCFTLLRETDVVLWPFPYDKPKSLPALPCSHTVHTKAETHMCAHTHSARH